MLEADSDMTGEEHSPAKEKFHLYKKHYHRDIFARVSEGSWVKKPVEPPAPIVEQDPWDSIISHKHFIRDPERNFTAKVNKRKKEMWGLHAVQGNTDRLFVTVPRDQLNYDEALEVCKLLVFCLERWPNMEDISSLDRYTNCTAARIRTLYNAAVQKACPDKAIVLGAPHIIRRGDEVKVKDSLQYIDYDSPEMKFRTYVKSFSTNFVIHPDTRIPEPENVSWAAVGSGQGGTDRPLSSLAKGLDPSIMMLERLARYVTAHVFRHYPVVMTENVMKRTVLHIEQEYARKLRFKRRQLGYDGGELVWTGKQRDGSMFINPPPALFANVTIKPFHITITSTNEAWLRIVLDAGSQVWHNNGDILETWRTIAATTDDVNQRIFNNEPSPDKCDSPLTTMCTASHICGGCGDSTICSGLRDHHDGYRACGPCRQENRTRTAAWASARAEARVTKSVRADAKSGGWSEDHQERVLNECLDDLRSSITTGDGCSYVDTYTGRWRMSLPQIHHPEAISIDAPFVAAQGPTGDTRYHTPGNLVATTAALNVMKNDKPPIVIKWIGEYANQARQLEPAAQRGDAEAKQRLEALQKELVEKFRLLTQVVRKIPHDRLSRLRVKFPQGASEYLKEEWRTGRPHQDHPPRAVACQTAPPVLPDWLIPRIGEIEEWTKHPLPKSSVDGCPYFLHEDTMPSEWCWAQFYSLMSYRWIRMDTYCNEEFDTDDTVWTLVLECILQACLRKMVILDTDIDAVRKREMQEKYADLLHLPLTLEARNLLTFGLAKLRHNEKMWSAWQIEPKSLEERLNADRRNNLITEPQATNFLRNNYSDVFKPLLKQLVLDVKIPKELADEDREMGPYDAALEGKLAQAVSKARSEAKKIRDARRKAGGAASTGSNTVEAVEGDSEDSCEEEWGSAMVLEEVLV